jgi:O-antigen/teichoic acid export membrane protein
LIVAARRLSGGEFGELTLMLAIGSMAGVLGDLGIQVFVAGETARLGYLDRGLLTSAIRRRLLLGIVAAAVATGLFMAAAPRAPHSIPLIFGASIVATTVYSTETAALNALRKSQVDAANESISRAAVLLVGSIWLELGGGVAAAITVYAVADVASAIAVTLVARRHLGDQSGDEVHEVSIRKSSHLAMAMMAAILYAKVDMWLLGILKTTVVVGRYAAADKILDGVLLIPTVLGTVGIARAGGVRWENRWDRMTSLIGAGVGSVVIPAGVVAVFAGPLLAVLFGPGFRAASGILVLLLASAVPGAIASVCSPIAAITVGWRFAVAVLTGLVLNVVLNLALVPALSGVGAAIANLISECYLGLTLLFLIRRLRAVGAAARSDDAS